MEYAILNTLVSAMNTPLWPLLTCWNDVNKEFSRQGRSSEILGRPLCQPYYMVLLLLLLLDLVAIGQSEQE